MIRFIDIKSQSKKELKDIIPIFKKVFLSGNFIMGNEMKKLNEKLKKLIGRKHCISVNSGHDALLFALYALGIKKNDEVITTSNSFIASASVIKHIGAKVIFADIGEDLNIDPESLKKSISSKTKALILVHLTGRMCKMDDIKNIIKNTKIKIIEDCAQSILSKYKNSYSGTFSDIACFSAHPLKNLNAIGDAGFILTNNEKYFNKISLAMNHGLKNRDSVETIGFNSRLDSIQCAILNYRIGKLKDLILKRRKLAGIYIKNLSKIKNVIIPKEEKENYNTFHLFIIRVKNRNNLINWLNKKGIETKIHYPIPIHKQKPFLKEKNRVELHNTEKFSKEILSLPINQYLRVKDINYVSKCIQEFYS